MLRDQCWEIERRIEIRKEKVVGNISRRFNTEKRCRKVEKRGMDERQEERRIANGE